MKKININLFFGFLFLFLFFFQSTEGFCRKRLLWEVNGGFLSQFEKVESQKRNIRGVHADFNLGLRIYGPLFFDFRLFNIDNAFPEFIPVPFLFAPSGLRSIINIFDLVALELGGGYQYISFLKLTSFGKDFNFRDLNGSKSCLPGKGTDGNSCNYEISSTGILQGHYPDDLNTNGRIYLRTGLYLNLSKNLNPHLFTEYSRIFLKKYYKEIEDFQYFILGVGVSL